MSISYTNLFGTKLGPIVATLNAINLSRGTTIPARIATHVTDFAGTDASLAASLWSALSSYQSGGSSLASSLQALFQNAIIDDVNAAISLPDQSLATALNALVNDMRTNAQTVSANVVGATVTANSGNTGNGTVLVGAKTKTGLALENTFAETVTASCTQDAQSGGATAGQEAIQFRCQPQSAGNQLNFPWPGGSGGAATATSISPGASQAGGAQNWLRNSNFETWTVSNIPDGWHVTVGTAGTQVLKSTTAGTFYDGVASLALVGDGSTLTALEQQFGVDTSVKMIPLDQLAWNLYVRVSSVPAAGVLEVALVDGTGTVIQDMQGANNVATLSLPGITTTFAPFGGFFRTPRVLPAAAYLRVRLSTALSSGSTVFIDHLALAEPTQLYQGGLYVAPFSASTGLIFGDGYSIAVTNSRAGQIQTAFEQFAGMRAKSLLLPSTTGTPTILNSVIA